MGILNVTPDSFSDGGRYRSPDAAVEHALQMASEGATIIDIGGESSRPGAKEISYEEEAKRVFPVIEALRQRSEILISIDTRKGEIAAGAIERGANWVNDISGATHDTAMLPTLQRYKPTVVLMHMRGTPETMQQKTDYKDVVREVRDWLLERAQTLEREGIGRKQIVLDPGLGFAKTTAQNWILLQSLPTLVETGYPILIGASRKSFIQKVLEEDSSNILEGSLAVAAWAAFQGCAYLRVHEVNETARLLRVLRTLST